MAPLRHVILYLSYLVPSKAPVNVTAMNFTSHRSINVSWHPIPHGFVHGILRGYRVLYKKVMVQDEEWSGIQVNYTVGPQNLSTMIEELDNYAVYQIQVLGFTIKGDGVISQPVYAGKTNSAILSDVGEDWERTRGAWNCGIESTILDPRFFCKRACYLVTNPPPQNFGKENFKGERPNETLLITYRSYRTCTLL